MTWEELVALFISNEQPVHYIRGAKLDAVSLQLAPATSFVSIKSSGRLNIGIYEGDETPSRRNAHRPVRGIGAELFAP